jgi:hypothetical protein
MIEIKGSVVGDAIKIIKTKYGEQTLSTVFGLLKPETRALFDTGHVMPMNWYSLDDFIQFLEADLKVTANGNEGELIKRSEDLIAAQLTGIYKAFIKLGSPGFILSRMATINQTYFRGVTVEINLPGPGSAVLKISGFTKEQRLIGLSIIGFYQKALEVSGAKNIKVEFTTPIGDDKGYSELSISWTDK